MRSSLPASDNLNRLGLKQKRSQCLEGVDVCVYLRNHIYQFKRLILIKSESNHLTVRVTVLGQTGLVLFTMK